ncbi:hypothetical protein [Bartonella tribocorum]|uniref:Uncharacterized protein n=1 Tax=Bartonella tribocorum TaxID=85701 RepID=A0A2M6UTI0_9HYPH|nr:hypothetical protein [Bartonella tribocorum]PIT69485.1 hypothetical protein CER18_03455 [Bartonella tribocorum]
MGSSSGSRDYCSADNFSSKYHSGFAFGSKYGAVIGLAGGVGLGLAMRNPSLAMNAGSFGLGVGDKFGGTIGGYAGYGVAAAQCGTQFLGQSMANSGGMLTHF